MRDYVVLQEGSYSVVTYDFAGMPAGVAYSPLEDMDLADNVCVDSNNPRGLMHPRTFLLMMYRADSLERLHSAGLTPRAGPPNDWEELIDLLAAHRGAVNTANGDAFPEHGMCITTHRDCGRLGDVWSAIAASVVQTTGTTQGVYWDLTAPPPSANPLVNSTGWRYASDVLRRLLLYNAPDYDDSGVTDEFNNTIAQKICTDVSPHFLNGSCMITLEWDAVFSLLGSIPDLSVAPLPGSRVVMDRTSDSATADNLVNCTWELCAASANHDLLYLDPAPAALSMAPLAPESLIQVNGKSPKTCDAKSVLQLEAAAVSEAALYNTVDTQSRPLVNRAPYSVVMFSYAMYHSSSGEVDVQNSTKLWEELSVATMDLALKIHHATIRRVMSAHDGYESATEGDSFIIAFATPANNTWGKTLAAAFPPALTGGQPDAPVHRFCKTSLGLTDKKQLVVYRGLCVRMGIHSGLDDPQYVVFNKVGSSYKYYGPFAETAKLVGDAAAGGLITLSGQAFDRLRNGSGAKGGGGSSGSLDTVIVYGGHYVLSEAPAPAKPKLKPNDTPRRSAEVVGSQHITVEMAAAEASGSDAPGEVGTPIFVAVPSSLVPRLAHTRPLRAVRMTQLGSLAAPTGTIAIAFMKVVGASTLLADLPGPASRALEQFQRLASRLLGEAGGYLVEGGDGLVLAAFGCPLAGVEWALKTVAGLKELDWEEELLAHELCEEVGLDVGAVTYSLTEASGRLSYRGKVMNRSARIAGTAAAGQVLCSGAVWLAAETGMALGTGGSVVGVSLGRIALKGISAPVEVVQCYRG
ncbi:hypothetical protein GPECTOR_1g392 [Gonium pectorale]|uniref:Guanylate cyclase domain-containing protein n=1 Tax=Gonium pectorale TaxID=33097 RepID=A0A150H3N3_GONPE|nr:hypothetical protein GPECTOR_1g392 [Gonium pectorale]|eukprot:KXZ56438.1 hypothetical protein GPECTOR_1g392 [Gonium pectorale]